MPTNAELSEIIAKNESDRVEFAESTGDLEKIRETICVFSNDFPHHREPGFIFVGIKEDGSCADLPISDDLMRELGGLRKEGRILPFPIAVLERRILNGCDVAVIRVEPSYNPPVKLDGKCWIHSGPGRAQASAEEESRLTEKRRWKVVPHDMYGVNGASVRDDLDVTKFRNEYLPHAVSAEVLKEDKRELDEQLRASRLTTQDGTPTVMGILMVGKNPSAWFPGAYIQFVRYAGDEATDAITDQREIHGTLGDQLVELDKILKVNISHAPDTSGETHVKKPDYPFDALCELARNAVIHRNYENSNTPVRIDWYANRVEIISPGSLYGVVTRENFGEPGGTDYRNPTIAEAMKILGFMQSFGRGIRTARKALQDNGNPLPGFDFQDTVVLATIEKQQ